MARPVPQGWEICRPPNQFDRDQLIGDAAPMPILLIAIILGIVEGVTEFLPVSSTGHLILATELLGFDAEKWAAFNVIIQLGAILAIIVLYWRTFWAVIEGLIRNQAMSWRFVRNVLIAFLPSAILGFILIKYIEALLGDPKVVAVMFILGGLAILAIERLVKRTDIVGVAEMPLKTVIGVGLIQCLSMIPGVSRSGATILGGLSLGVERRTAAEFSFFLAIPTMLGATTLELVKHHDTLLAGASGVGFGTVAVGFIVSFVVAIVVVKGFVHYISRHGFAPFAWYRIVAGTAALVWLTIR
jgi:undecaprenyl-diphosphatase